jgi:hypothetical protein
MTARLETAIRVPANRYNYQLPQRVVRVQIERLEGASRPVGLGTVAPNSRWGTGEDQIDARDGSVCGARCSLTN